MISQTSRILRELKTHPNGIENWKMPRMGILSYTKRIQELRESGHEIVAERQYMRGRATGTWIYRLAGQESKRKWYQRKTK